MAATSAVVELMPADSLGRDTAEEAAFLWWHNSLDGLDVIGLDHRETSGNPDKIPPFISALRVILTPSKDSRAVSHMFISIKE